MSKKQKKMLVRILLSTALWIVCWVVEGLSPWMQYLYLVPYLLVGGDILKKAGKGICRGQVFDENFLMAVATIGAVLLGEFSEGVAVMLFYQVGEFFQSYAVGKSRKNISALMDIRPDYANIEIDGKLEQVDPEEVSIGSIIVVQPGERIPIDGIVIEGTSFVDTSALTGESVPREVQKEDEVLSGCINGAGVLSIRTTKEFGESTVARIMDLVENSSSRKSKSENFISKFARIYTPIVCYLALALAILPPLVQILLGQSGGLALWTSWIMRGLTFLVISCPCALVISIPLSFFGGIGGASREGILIKGSNYMETLAKVRTVVFDKTGTMTKGSFSVAGIYPAKEDTWDEKQLLFYASHVEAYSNHPISKSLQAAYEGELRQNRVTDLEELAGMGVRGKVDGVAVAAGNDKLMTQLGISYEKMMKAGTIVYVAIENEYAGAILITDQLKETAKKSIVELKKNGIQQTVMLTGDAKNAAEEVASILGIGTVYSELLPADKVERIEEILANAKGTDKVAFVGDGINDAPVLSRADVGIAMGAMGSDAAIEAADIVLMDDDPVKIARAIRIAKKCISIVYQNIYFAIGVKVICLVLGALGMANMWIAIFADVGVMILAVLNAIRTLKVRNA